MRWQFGSAELDVATRELRVGGVVRRVQPQVLDVLASSGTATASSRRTSSFASCGRTRW